MENIRGRGDYPVDMDRSGRKVHHEERFGFCAFPPMRSGGGEYRFFVNEINTMRRGGVGSRGTFPSDEILKGFSRPSD